MVLPQTLLVGDIIIEKTAFTLKREMVKPLPAGGRIRMNGRIKGYVNGVVDGEFIGVIEGEMGAVVRAKDTVENVDLDSQYARDAELTPTVSEQEQQDIDPMPRMMGLVTIPLPAWRSRWPRLPLAVGPSMVRTRTA